MQKYAVDDDVPPSQPIDEELDEWERDGMFEDKADDDNVEEAPSKVVKERKQIIRLSRKWSSWARPKKLFKAFEHLNLSPRVLRVTFQNFALKRRPICPNPQSLVQISIIYK